MKLLIIIIFLCPLYAWSQLIVSYPIAQIPAVTTGDSTYIASVTRGEVTFADTKDTVGVAFSGDPAKTIVWMGETWGNAGYQDNLAVPVVESGRILFRRSEDPGFEPVVGWQAVTKTRGWRVIHLDTNFAASTSNMTFNLGTTVDTNKTYVIVHMTDKTGTAGQFKFIGSGSQLFPTTSTVSLDWVGSPGEGWLGIQVVEDTNCTVRRDYGPSSSWTTSTTRTLVSTPVLKTIPIPLYSWAYGGSYTGANGDSAGTNMLLFDQTATTTASVTRSINYTVITNSQHWCTQWVEFTDNTTIDTLWAGLSNVETYVPVSHDEVDYNQTVNVTAGFRNMGGKGALLTTRISALLFRTVPIDNTSFMVYRGHSGSIAATVKFLQIRYLTKELLP
jgi:hypothetical protein